MLFAGDSVKAQTKQVFENMVAMLEVRAAATHPGRPRKQAGSRLIADRSPLSQESGSGLRKVLTCTCLLEDISMYAEFNEVGRPPAPATAHRPRPSPMIESPPHRPRQLYLEYFPDSATRPARACFGGN